MFEDQLKFSTWPNWMSGSVQMAMRLKDWFTLNLLLFAGLVMRGSSMGSFSFSTTMTKSSVTFWSGETTSFTRRVNVRVPTSLFWGAKVMVPAASSWSTAREVTEAVSWSPSTSARV